MRKKIHGLILPLLIAFIIASAPSFAQEPSVSRFDLPNGMVLLTQEEHENDIVSIEVFVNAGLLHETDQNAGIINLIQNLILKGAGKYNSQQIAEMLELSGIMMSASSSPDFAEISCTTTSKNFAHAVQILGDVLSNPRFDQAEIDKEKKNITEQIEGEQSAFTAIYNIFLQNFYRYHPYRQPILGQAKAIKNLTRDNILDFYRTYYVPNRMVIVVSGNINKNEVKETVKKVFKNFNPSNPRPIEITWEPPNEEREIYLSSSGNLSWLFIGYQAPEVISEDYYAMKLIYSYLGEGLSSRIWTELREKRGMAYDLGAFYPSLEGPSHFIAYIVTTPDKILESKRRILYEISQIKSSGIPDFQLEQVKQKVIGGYLLERETDRGKAESLGSAEIQGKGYMADENFAKKIEEVTSEQIKAVANKYLKNYIMVIVLPGQPIPGQLMEE
ncbi:MAG: insulinase family protein [Actinobacteria bacterium]|nr:insulinase family protein [Actinomycetota bacterium]